MKSFASSPRIVAPRVILTAIAIAIAVVGSLGVIGWKWRSPLLSTSLHAQEAYARPAALPTAAPNDATLNTVESAVPNSQRVEAPRQATQGESNGRNADVDGNGSGGSPNVVLAQAVAGTTSTSQGGTPEGKATLGVAAIKPTPALVAAVETVGKSNPMARVVESLDSQLSDRFNATRKFEIVSRSDLKELLKEQGLADSGNVDANDKSAAKSFKIAGVKYLLVTTLDDFQDMTAKEELKIQKEVLQVRTIRLSAIGKIYDSTTGKLLESANFQASTNKDVTDFATTTLDGNRTDFLLVAIARDMAGKIANRVVEVISPAKVTDVTGKQVTIDWGDGMFLAKGDKFEVFKLKEKANADPVEISIGFVEIKRVNPKSSTAEIVGENLGIDEGCILRRATTSQ